MRIERYAKISTDDSILDFSDYRLDFIPDGNHRENPIKPKTKKKEEDKREEDIQTPSKKRGTV
jgi:hypothetical protein